MNVSKLYSAQLMGLRSEIITIEVDISNGLHSFSVVGMGDRSVDEARDRIAAAIKNTGYTSPKQKNQKVTISLAPAHIRKEGSSFDLAMALAYLVATEDIVMESDTTLFLGELSLEGAIRKVGGILPILCQAISHGFTTVFIPKDNEKEACLAQNITIYAVSSMKEIIQHLQNKKILQPLIHIPALDLYDECYSQRTNDMSVVRGNETAKRGLEIAAAGAHNIVMSGPPGTGKTMLAHSFHSILPRLSYDHSVEVTSIYSVAHILDKEMITVPPFRTPHHTASYASIIGGGSFPKPGEITLAHRGVLFLDEFPEFSRDVIESLRQPLEDRVITISRARGIVTFPAQCILVASMNPCPCGLGKSAGCTCSDRMLNIYNKRLSRPITDRIDIWVAVSKIDYDALSEPSSKTDTSEMIRTRVIQARKIQKDRFIAHGLPIDFNSEMSAQNIEKCINMSSEARSALRLAAEKMNISGRAFHRTIKVARTIADLTTSNDITKEHILEALQYREKI